MRNAFDIDQTDADSDSGMERDKGRIFLGAIMGGFFTPNNTPREAAKRKLAEIWETHRVSRRPVGKRSLLSFTDNEKVNGGA